jgi:hypothetical protein
MDAFVVLYVYWYCRFEFSNFPLSSKHSDVRRGSGEGPLVEVLRDSKIWSPAVDHTKPSQEGGRTRNDTPYVVRNNDAAFDAAFDAAVATNV